MARYDRLAPLGMPRREDAFSGWYVLRDLEGQERDGDAARRGRLHFLAVRPLHRLLHASSIVPQDSLDRQVDRVREELGQLAARDPERAALAHFLDDVRTGNIEILLPGTLAMALFALGNGRAAAAEEYAECALALARRQDRGPWRAASTRVLSRIAVQNGRLEAGLDLAQRACELALEGDHRLEWLHCTGQLAAVLRAKNDPNQAREVLMVALRRAREWRNETAVGIALGALCRHCASVGQDDAAVEHGGAALKLLDDPTERASVLLLLGPALSRLGLLRAAERCFTLVSQRAADPAQRAMAGAGLCGCAAMASDETRFKERVTLTLRDLPQLARFDRAQVLCTLAHAAVLIGHTALGREQVRQAITLLGDNGPPEIVRQAETVLHGLEQAAATEIRATRVPTASDQTRRIASELERAVDTLTPATR